MSWNVWCRSRISGREAPARGSDDKIKEFPSKEAAEAYARKYRTMDHHYFAVPGRDEFEDEDEMDESKKIEESDEFFNFRSIAKKGDEKKPEDGKDKKDDEYLSFKSLAKKEADAKPACDAGDRDNDDGACDVGPDGDMLDEAEKGSLRAALASPDEEYGPGFERDKTWIHNPYWDEDGMEMVDPDEYYAVDPDACPGCGSKPGEGIKDSCDDPMGCGYWKGRRDEARSLSERDPEEKELPDEDVCYGCGQKDGHDGPCYDPSDDDLDEVSPPGFEKAVKAMKKSSDVDNPWAVAWSMKNKGYKKSDETAGDKDDDMLLDEDDIGGKECATCSGRVDAGGNCHACLGREEKKRDAREKHAAKDIEEEDDICHECNESLSWHVPGCNNHNQISESEMMSRMDKLMNTLIEAPEASGADDMLDVHDENRREGIRQIAVVLAGALSRAADEVEDAIASSGMNYPARREDIWEWAQDTTGDVMDEFAEHDDVYVAISRLLKNAVVRLQDGSQGVQESRKLSEHMTYDDVMMEEEPVMISNARARKEIDKHQADWDEFVEEFGALPEYDARQVLGWLGY